MATINTNKSMEYFRTNFDVSLPVRDWQQETEQVHTFQRTLNAYTDRINDNF
jgi:hypothetical protein